LGCDSCVHSDKCVESPSGALCVCQSGYHGLRCDQPGDPCDAVSCIRPLVCQPLIAAGGTQTTCKCPIGWTGPKCLQNTAVSFNESSLFIHQSPSVMIGSFLRPSAYALSFAMRTTAPTDVLISVINEAGYQLLSRSLPRLTSFDVFATRVGKIGDSESSLLAVWRTSALTIVMLLTSPCPAEALESCNG
ncbi:EGF-like domain protein, partial [Ostertagia ostertagi]